MYNYHTHTDRCKHAVGSVGDFAARAVELGYKTLGFSDHIPFPDDRWIKYRMSPEEMGDYINDIDQAIIDFPQLEIIKGLECEYFTDLKNYYQDMKEKWELEYLVCGCHWIPFQGEWLSLAAIDNVQRLKAHVDYTIKSMETGLFDFLAHPDNFGYGYLEWDKEAEEASKDIITAAKELDIPLEINGYGFSKGPLKTKSGLRPPYPQSQFWEIVADQGFPVVVSTDAHDPEELKTCREKPLALAEKYGLNVIDPIKRKK